MREKVKAPQHTMLTARPHHTKNYFSILSAVLQSVMRFVGVFLFFLGGSAMDSENLLYPIALLAAGATIIYFTSREDFR